MSDCKERIGNFEQYSKFHMCGQSPHIRKPDFECENEVIVFKSSRESRGSKRRDSD